MSTTASRGFRFSILANQMRGWDLRPFSTVFLAKAILPPNKHRISNYLLKQQKKSWYSHLDRSTHFRSQSYTIHPGLKRLKELTSFRQSSLVPDKWYKGGRDHGRNGKLQQSIYDTQKTWHYFRRRLLLSIGFFLLDSSIGDIITGEPFLVMKSIDYCYSLSSSDDEGLDHLLQRFWKLDT